MIGDPLFYQRLARILELRRGPGPEVPVEVIGAVITIDGALLLERLSQGRLAGPGGESIYFGGGGRATAAAVVGDVSRVRLSIRGRPPLPVVPAHTVFLNYIRAMPLSDADMWIALPIVGASGASFPRNLATNAESLISQWDIINTGTGGPPADRVFSAFLPANQAYVFDGLANRAAIAAQRITRGVTVVSDEWIEVGLSGTANNTALTGAFSFVISTEILP